MMNKTSKRKIETGSDPARHAAPGTGKEDYPERLNPCADGASVLERELADDSSYTCVHTAHKVRIDFESMGGWRWINRKMIAGDMWKLSEIWISVPISKGPLQHEDTQSFTASRVITAELSGWYIPYAPQNINNVDCLAGSRRFADPCFWETEWFNILHITC